MSDLSKLKEILKNQKEEGIKSEDWKRLDYKIEKTHEDITLRIDSLEVGFVFSLKGRLIGAYNRKE